MNRLLSALQYTQTSEGRGVGGGTVISQINNIENISNDYNGFLKNSDFQMYIQGYIFFCT